VRVRHETDTEISNQQRNQPAISPASGIVEIVKDMVDSADHSSNIRSCVLSSLRMSRIADPVQAFASREVA
jgi:hypothetical protein